MELDFDRFLKGENGKMKNKKRIFAIIGIVILVGLYVTTFVSSFFATVDTAGLFKASLFLSFLIPVLIYAYTLFHKTVFSNKDSEEE